MATYFVDDGGDGSDGSTWAKAYTSLQALVTAVGTALTTSGNIIYVGSDHVDQNSYSANHTFTGPSSAGPVLLISSTVGSGTTVSYAASTTRQIDTSNNDANTYTLTFDGAFAFYGISTKSGGNISISSDDNEATWLEDFRFAPAVNGIIYLGTTVGSKIRAYNITADLTSDAIGERENEIFNITGFGVDIEGLTFVNAGYRIGTAFAFNSNGGGVGGVTISGANFSSFSGSCEIFNPAYLAGTATVSNCIFPTNIALHSSDAWTYLSGKIVATSIGSENSPLLLTNQQIITPYGKQLSSAQYVRQDGATTAINRYSLRIDSTTSACSEQTPFYTSWIYGTLTSTGSKTFAVYITNDTADFTNSEVWLEVEFMSTANELLFGNTNSRRIITATASTITDDTASVWLNSAYSLPTYTYKQKLSVTATVNATGPFRARVVIAKASMTTDRYLYIDPAVIVT